MIDLSWFILAPIVALIVELGYALCVAAGLHVPEPDDDEGWCI